uniref:Uncharacterized protein n=2 Tax=Brassica oleracea TaxID=3712 RepID=A0A0D3BLA3_BRAOL|nr:unnamed protein product [Brassica oleracea]
MGLMRSVLPNAKQIFKSQSMRNKNGPPSSTTTSGLVPKGHGRGPKKAQQSKPYLKDTYAKRVFRKKEAKDTCRTQGTVSMPPPTEALRRRTTSSAPQTTGNLPGTSLLSTNPPSHVFRTSERINRSVRDLIRHHTPQTQRRGFKLILNPNQPQHPTIGNRPEFQRTKAPSSS